MRTAFGLLLLLVAGLTITSCQREIDGEFPSPDPSGEDSTYISMYVEVDTTYPAGSDTAFKHTFKYDAQKRITEIVEYNYQTGSPLLQRVIVEKYLYNGTDTVPSRYIIADYDGSGNKLQMDSVFLKYDANNIITEDSVRRTDIGTGTLLVYVSKFIKQSGDKYKVAFSGDPYLYDSVIVTQTSSGSTITDKKEYYSSGALTSTFTFKTTVDAKLNPFYRIGLKYPVNEIISGGFFTLNEKNNPVGYERSGSFGSEQFIITYEYRSDGLPLISRLWSTAIPANVDKGFYYYTKL